jgi:predicted amidohydrolase
MQPQPLEIEGTWEEVAEHALDLAGRRVRLIVLPEAAGLSTWPGPFDSPFTFEVRRHLGG